MLLSWRVGSQRSRSSERRRSRREVADEEPPAIFNAADGTWNQRAGVEERVRKTLELSIPNEATRREALRFLALAIENADEERGNAWYLRETEHGLRLMTGRLLACEIAPSKMRVSVIGPVSEDVRGALGAEAENDGSLSRFPGGLAPYVPRRARGGSSRLAQATGSTASLTWRWRACGVRSASKITSLKRSPTSPAS